MVKRVLRKSDVQTLQTLATNIFWERHVKNINKALPSLSAAFTLVRSKYEPVESTKF